MVVISVPGQSGLARFVKLPPVEEKKIADIVKFEAKQQIPFPLEEVVWDFQKIGQGDVTDGFAMETEIGLFAMKRDMVHRALQQFKDVNVEVHVDPDGAAGAVQLRRLRPAAQGRHRRRNRRAKAADKKECVVALDIGTDNSNLIITDGGKIIWQRPIPLGGNHFTRALTKDMKLTFAKAEHLKRNAAKSPDLKKILASLKTGAQRLRRRGAALAGLLHQHPPRCPRSSTWSAWAMPSACRACRSSSRKSCSSKSAS